MAIEAARGMNYLHCSKPPILHRDLKSLNILLDDNWGVRVCDFGFTVVKEQAMSTTSKAGTAQWMAPEVLKSGRSDEKSDVFSFGIVLWELYTHQAPYPKMKSSIVVQKVLKEGLRPTIPKKCPESVSKLMRDCWNEDPEKRPTFQEIIHELETIQAEDANKGFSLWKRSNPNPN